jgi:hypothetical protein
MKLFGSRFLMVAGLAGTAGLFFNVGCSSGSNGGGTGGTTGTGGAGTGGSHTGGTTGTGGTHTGGTTGTGGGGGASATGGTAGGSATGGTAGGSATGGAGGVKATGGAGGAGGASNTDGGTQQYAAFTYTFDSDTQGFGFNTFAPSDGSTNLTLGDAGTPPSLTWNSSVGDPNPGSLEIQAKFSGYRQFVQAAVTVKPTANASGRTAQAWVMLEKVDGGPTLAVGAQLEFNSGTSYNGFAGTAYTSLTPGTWTKLTLPLTASSSFDPTQIIQIAVQFTTESQPDGGGAFGAAIPATFLIDSITDGSGLPPAPPLNLTFDTSLQGFSLSDSSFVFPDGGAAPALTFDSTEGDPAGSAKLVIPFNSYNQQVDTQINLSPTINLTGKTIHAMVKLDSGTFTGGYLQLHASGPDYSHYAQATGAGAINAATLGTGQWVDLTMPLSAVTTTGFDATKILQVGIQFGTGSGPEGGAFPTTTQPVTFHIDSIVAE